MNLDLLIEGGYKFKPIMIKIAKEIFRKEAELEGTEGLIELQKAIYEFIVSIGEIKRNLLKKF